MGLVECEEAAISLGLSPDWGNGREVRFTAKYEKSIPGESPHEAKKRPYGCTTIGNCVYTKEHICVTIKPANHLIADHNTILCTLTSSLSELLVYLFQWIRIFVLKSTTSEQNECHVSSRFNLHLFILFHFCWCILVFIVY